MAKTYRDLLIWGESLKLVVELYNITRKFPADEKFGLISQIRRAAVSVPAIIAEGSGRKSRKDTLNFYHIARGSLNESMLNC